MEGEAEPVPRPGGSRSLVIALVAVIVVIVVVIGVLFAAGILRTGPEGPAAEGLLPEAIYFTGYTGDGDKLIPEWWANRANWPVEWFWSEGLKAQSFIDRLEAAGVDTQLFIGTNPVGALTDQVNTSNSLFVTAFEAEYGVNPQVFDPHSYDATFVIALAMLKANLAGDVITGRNIALHLRDVGNPPGTVIAPTEWAKAVTALTAGTDINYEGASGAVDFDVFGEGPSDYEIYGVNATGGLFEFDRISLQEILEFAPPLVQPTFEVSRAFAPPTPSEARIGTMLPITGALADFGGTAQQATKLAAKHVNDNGGIAGTPLALLHQDSAANPTIATDAANALAATGVPAVVGAAASSASQAAFSVFEPAGILQMSPASTSAVFTTADATDLFWRTAPSDIYQGRAAAKYAIEVKGWRVMSTIFVNNAYGVGLTRVFESEFIEHNGTILRSAAYQPDQASYLSVLELVFTAVQPAAAPPLAAMVAPRRSVAS